MTKTSDSTKKSAPREIDPAKLDQVVGGASIVVHDLTGGTSDARKQEQSEK